MEYSESSPGGVQDYDYYNLSEFKERPTHDDMLIGDWIGSTSHPLIKKIVFEKAGMFDEELPARQDYDMWIRISKYYSIKGIRDKLFIHKLHDGEQITKSRTKAYMAFCRLYDKYKVEYKNNPEAWLNIQVAIASNQKGITGFLRLFATRVVRKTYHIIKAVTQRKKE